MWGVALHHTDLASFGWQTNPTKNTQAIRPLTTI
jgi:hypothetical protein